MVIKKKKITKTSPKEKIAKKAKEVVKNKKKSEPVKDVTPKKSSKVVKSAKSSKGSSSSKLDTFESEHGSIHSNEPLITPPCRLAFVTLKEPSKKYKKYGANLLFTPEQKEHDEFFVKLRAQAAILKKMKFGENFPKNIKRPKLLSDGNDVDYDGYEDMVYIVANNPNQPKVSKKSKYAIDEIKSGMIARCVIYLGLGDDGWFYKLETVKALKDDGTNWSGGPDTSDLVDEVEEEEEYTDDDDLEDDTESEESDEEESEEEESEDDEESEEEESDEEESEEEESDDEDEDEDF